MLKYFSSWGFFDDYSDRAMAFAGMLDREHYILYSAHYI